MRRTKLRCCPGLVDEFSKYADLGSAVLETRPPNADAIRSGITRLLLWFLILVSSITTARTFSTDRILVDCSADLVATMTVSRRFRQTDIFFGR
jgi:hypothetical protein